MSAPSCVICQRIAKPPVDDGVFIAELSESVVILSDDQFYDGYCILMLKEHHEHLGQLSRDRQARLWNDVAAVAAAITETVSPARMNYECLGNSVPHIHWHVIPRRADDDRREEPIWVRPAAERRGNASLEDRKAAVARLRAALQRLS